MGSGSGSGWRRSPARPSGPNRRPGRRSPGRCGWPRTGWTAAPARRAGDRGCPPVPAATRTDRARRRDRRGAGRAPGGAGRSRPGGAWVRPAEARRYPPAKLWQDDRGSSTWASPFRSRFWRCTCAGRSCGQPTGVAIGSGRGADRAPRRLPATFPWERRAQPRRPARSPAALWAAQPTASACTGGRLPRRCETAQACRHRTSGPRAWLPRRTRRGCPCRATERFGAPVELPCCVLRAAARARHRSTHVR